MTSKTRLLVVGVGSIGERHARCFSRTGRVELSICETNASLREQVAQRYGARRSFATLDDALAEPCDAAVVCTPAHLHVPMAQRLVVAGAHVLIEKPLSTRLEGIADLRAAARQRGLALGVAYVLRLHPALRAMREAIASGRFGEPVEIVGVSGQHFPKYRPAYREIYYNSRATGGGAVQDALTHMLNAGEWLVGPVERLAADVGHQALEGVEVEDTVHLIARQGAVMGSYALNQHQPPNESTLTVVCRQGAARFESHRNRWRWMTGPDDPWTDETFPDLERDTLFVLQADAFLDAVASGAEPPCGLDEAEQTLRAAHAILRAAESRQWESVR